MNSLAFIQEPRRRQDLQRPDHVRRIDLAGFMVIRYFNSTGSRWQGADSAAPGVMLAYGIGRIGCQVSGDGDWGIVNTTT
jgi:hypothetical protein